MQAKPEEKVEYKSLDRLRDLARTMPLKSRGAKAFLVPRLFIEKIRIKWNRLKERLVKYVGEDTVEAKIEAKEEKIDDKLKSWNNYVSNVESHMVESNNTKNILNAAAALSYSKEKIEQLKSKKVKVASKGLGIFTLSAMALKKVASDKFYEIKDSIEKRRQARAEKKEAKAEEKAARKETRKVEKAEKNRVRESIKTERTELLQQILEELKESNRLRRMQIELMMRGYNQNQSQVVPATK